MIGVFLQAIFVIGLLTPFTVGQGSKCYNYSCSSKDFSIFAGASPQIAALSKQFPYTRYCGEKEPPQDPGTICTSSGACFAGIATISIAGLGEAKLIHKNCSDSAVDECYEQAYGKKLGQGDIKCERLLRNELENSQGSGGSKDPKQQKLQKCLQDTGLFPAAGIGGPRQANEEKPPSKDDTIDVCICKGDLCSDQAKIRDAFKKPGGTKSAGQSLLMSTIYYSNPFWLLYFLSTSFHF